MKKWTIIFIFFFFYKTTGAFEQKAGLGYKVDNNHACPTKWAIKPDNFGLKLYFDNPETKTKCYVSRLENDKNPIGYFSITQVNNQLVLSGDIDLSGPHINQILLDYYFNSPDYLIKRFSGDTGNMYIHLDIINDRFAILITEAESNYAALFSINKKDGKYYLTNPFNLVSFEKMQHFDNNYFSVKLYNRKVDIFFDNGRKPYTIKKKKNTLDGKIVFIPKGNHSDIDQLINKISNRLDRVDGKKSKYIKQWIKGEGLLSKSSSIKVKADNKTRLSHWVRRYLKKYNIVLHKNQSYYFMTDIAVYRVMDHYDDKGNLIE